MGFIRVNSCPADSETWQQLAKQCQNSDHYHCLFNDFLQTVSGCNDWIWVEPGHCPVYISEALQMDTEKCQHQCPEIDRSYKSFDVYKYSRCYTNQQPHSSSTAAVTNITDDPGPLPPGGSSFNVAAVVVPVLLVVIAAVVFVVLICRRYKDLAQCPYRYDRTTDNSKRKKNDSRMPRRMLSCFHSVSRNECNLENAPLNQGADGNSRQTECHIEEEAQKKESECSSREKRSQHGNDNSASTKRKKDNSGILRRILSCTCNAENPLDKEEVDVNANPPDLEEEAHEEKSEYLSREEFLQHESINIENLAEDTTLVLRLANNLQKDRTLALIGEWGSGKRTLAVQIALQVEKIEKKTFNFKVLQEFQDDTRSKIEALKSTDPTILLIPDLCRSWHTEHHMADIINCVRSGLSSNTYIIATIRNAVYQSCTEYIRSSIDDLFTRRMLIKPSHRMLSKILDKYNVHSTNPSRDYILKLNSVIGTPLIVTLCVKNPDYKSSSFLDDPLSFITSKLKKMNSSDDANDRLKFGILVYIVQEGETVEKNTLENCSDPSMFAFTGKNSNMFTTCNIHGCITELLDDYLEETIDGKSYRIVHEVITRCIFLTAAEMDFPSLIGKCDDFLLFDCIRLQSPMEREFFKKKFILDTRELKVGIPTESYQDLAKALRQRNDDVMSLVRKVNWFEKERFKKVLSSVERV
ncbi:uncharacterized protein LOC125683231 isoform X2 [Ostrea edulis]|uniref:uncharacterized protein LOC125683231 isoform X2 n=1 Tax=Ostrea edulis TaxID=37623 RepID=UPI0024AEE638|nr:uncharacterized protein LOC125683231 isoform X2 [Ostrea edulis]